MSLKTKIKMPSLKNVITLSQAAKISGYSQDYLGFLIRSGEMKGIKKGRTWLTTEDEVRNYIFKRKVGKKDLALPLFLSRRRRKNILIATLVLLFVVWMFLPEIYKNNDGVRVEEIRSGINGDTTLNFSN